MENKTDALKRLPKKDRDEVARINGLRCEREQGATDRDVVQYYLARIKNYAAKQTLSNDDLTGEFHWLQMHFRDGAIIDRFLHDDPSMLATGLSTAARFGFLMALTGGTGYSGGYDCAHVFDLLRAIACRDRAVTESFLTQFPSPFKHGHQSTVLLCNGIYAALDSEPASLLRFEPKLRSRKESKFFRAMYDCLVAIADTAPCDVASTISEMLRGNRRQDRLSQMEKIVSIEAHAFYWLAAESSPELVSQVDTRAAFTWDSEFHSFLESSSPSSIGPRLDVMESNEVLGRWLVELPETIDVNELLASL